MSVMVSDLEPKFAAVEVELLEAMARVVRAAELWVKYGEVELYDELEEALEALPEHLRNG